MPRKDLLVVITSSVIGDGEPDLGEKLMRGFLTQLLEGGALPARMIFMGTGVFLTTSEDGSWADLLERFETAGTGIQSCGTCLEYYNRADRLRIGEAGNMTDTVQAMVQYEKVIRM